MKHHLLILALLFTFIGAGIAQQKEKGYCSYYGKEFNGRKTASGEKYNLKEFTAAHRTHPFGTYLKVTNTSNNSSVIVRVNDRGPFSKKRVVDISRAAAEKIDMIRDGVALVEVTVVDKNTKVSDESIPTIDTTSHAKHHHKHDKTDTIATTVPVITNSGTGEFGVNCFYDKKGTKITPKGMGIQVFSTSDIEKLKVKLETLQQQGFPQLVIESVEVSGKQVFRIFVGQYRDNQSTTADKEQLKTLGYNGFVKHYPSTSKKH